MHGGGGGGHGGFGGHHGGVGHHGHHGAAGTPGFAAGMPGLLPGEPRRRQIGSFWGSLVMVSVMVLAGVAIIVVAALGH